MAAKSDMENAENFDSSQQLLFMKAKYDLEKKISLELETTIISCELAQCDGYKRFLFNESKAAQEECMKMRQHKELLSVSMMFLQRELDKIMKILRLFQEESIKFQVTEEELRKTFCQHTINYNELKHHVKSLSDNTKTYNINMQNIEKLKVAYILKQSTLIDCDSSLCEIKLKYNDDVKALSDNLSQRKLNLNNLIVTNNMMKKSINKNSEEFQANKNNLLELKGNNTNLRTMLNDHESKSNTIINDLNDKFYNQTELYNQALATLDEKENEYTEIRKIENDLKISNNQCLTEIEVNGQKISLIENFKVILNNFIEKYNKYVVLKKHLLEVQNKNLNIKREYEKSKAMHKKLKEQNGEINKKNLIESAEFNEWKQMFEENIKKTNDDYENQVMFLQKELSEIKDISRNALECQKKSFVDELKDIQINIETNKKELERLAAESSIVEIKYKSALDRKEMLTNSYKCMQDSDENQPIGILKSSRADIVQLNSNKNVTFRSNVSYETASQISVDSFLEEIKRINNSTASPTESIDDLRSTIQTRKRNRFD